MFCHENTGTNPIRGPLCLHKAAIYSTYVNLKPVQLQFPGAYRNVSLHTNIFSTWWIKWSHEHAVSSFTSIISVTFCL